MKDSEWSVWLSQWLMKHPIKSDKKLDEPGYTREVMARVRMLDEEKAKHGYLRESLNRIFVRPRLAMALGSVSTVLLIASLFVINRGPYRFASMERDLQLLASLESGQSKDLIDEIAPIEVSDIESYLRESDRIILAKNEKIYNEEWIYQTIELLDGLDENGKSLQGQVFKDMPDSEIEEMRLIDQLEFPA